MVYPRSIPSSTAAENDHDPDISPMPSSGQERVAALKELGGTFNEGHRRVSKIATPTSSDTIPSFMDTNQIEELLKKPSKSLQEASREALADKPETLPDKSSPLREEGYECGGEGDKAA
ncbi:hypothetical protein BDB00DRAFT_584149 [Zychaea mexicana]|uniref:uncharacterized protein n=1 Tax=Zychaea mexicana TaxID=64656 RepID=UPI0022FEBB54|nr:uncharacterized protein BDB00DRAFT_584149 [Zychaea mexicana]KAI9497625.1 hypothetical protein BDB00DRAFT_584149 [Zychaea mexicana]